MTMQTIQFKVDNNYLTFIKTLLDNLTIGIKDLSIYKESYSSSYFQSLEDEYIFYLIELDGEIQQEKLKIDRTFYKDKTKAKNWRNSIIEVIHPDKSQHPNATKATEILNEIYTRMIKNAKY